MSSAGMLFWEACISVYMPARLSQGGSRQMLSDWFNIYTGKHFIKKVYTLGHPKMQHLFPWIFHLWYPLEKVETVADFIFLGSKITADGDCRHEIKRCLLLGRKAMTNLDCILKSRDITLPPKSVESKL